MVNIEQMLRHFYAEDYRPLSDKSISYHGDVGVEKRRIFEESGILHEVTTIIATITALRFRTQIVSFAGVGHRFFLHLLPFV